MNILADTSHRTWPVSQRPWRLLMQWHNLLFMHWPVPAALLRPWIPPALELETFDGSAWIGIVPFDMRGVYPRHTFAVPWLSAFPELNVRTYVTAGGKPGVWFFSLDAGNPVGVRLARGLFHLPYFDARMAFEERGDVTHYASQRTHRNAKPALFRARYHPTGAVFRSSLGTLESWLTERYCLYAANQRGHVWRGDIHHQPWPLQPAEAEVEINTMTHQIALPLPNTPPLLHFARRLDVVAWELEAVDVKG